LQHKTACLRSSSHSESGMLKKLAANLRSRPFRVNLAR
jgi:hypothetical protein